ncbi:hypothetical protein ACLEPN_37800 [Myxococcus sp. 1LA]
MRERPMLFSGPMVSALLDGRKTVTRRLVKPHHLGGTLDVVDVLNAGNAERAQVHCPYGAPGDRLWVKETWALEDCGPDGERVVWRADRAAAWRTNLADVYYLASNYEPSRWRPSIHMTRWASRLTLEVVSIRAERLHDITEADAQAEGVERHPTENGWRNYEPEPAFEAVTYHATARESFASLWRSINGPQSWDDNPWVWRVEFRRARGLNGGTL